MCVCVTINSKQARLSGEKEAQMHRLISEARNEATMMREHAARLVVERVNEAAAASDSAQALEEVAREIAKMSAVLEQVLEVVVVVGGGIRASGGGLGANMQMVVVAVAVGGNTQVVVGGRVYASEMWWWGGDDTRAVLVVIRQGRRGRPAHMSNVPCEVDSSRNKNFLKSHCQQTI